MTPLSQPLGALLRILLALALAFASEGCVSMRSGRHPKVDPAAHGTPSSAADQALTSRPGQPTPEGRVGTVRMIGRDGKFVLVETLNGGTLNLPDGLDLHCRSGAEPGAAATADLRLSRERRQQFASADVVSGQPHVGDAVFVGGPAATASGGIVAPSLLPAELGGTLPPPAAAGGRP